MPENLFKIGEHQIHEIIRCKFSHYFLRFIKNYALEPVFEIVEKTCFPETAKLTLNHCDSKETSFSVNNIRLTDEITSI